MTPVHAQRPGRSPVARALILAAAVGAMVLTACDSGSTGPSGTPTPSPSPTPAPGSRAAFIAAADRACEAAHARLDNRPAPRSLGEDVPYLDTTIEVETALEQQLRALVPPASDASTVAGLLDSFHDLIVRIREVRRLAAAVDVTETDRATSDLVLQQARVSIGARTFGFRSCGIPAEPRSSPSPTDSSSPQRV